MSIPAKDTSSNLGFYLSTASDDEKFIKVDLPCNLKKGIESDDSNQLKKSSKSENFFNENHTSVTQSAHRRKILKGTKIQTPRPHDFYSASKHDIILSRAKPSHTTVVTIPSDTDSDDCIIENIVAPSVSVVQSPEMKINDTCTANYASDLSDEDNLCFEKTENIKLHFHTTPIATARKPRFANQTKFSKSKASIIYTESTPVPKRARSCLSFTPEMQAFYDSDIPGHFDLDEVHSQQSGHPSKWRINREDQWPSRGRSVEHRVRCTRCRDHGHLVKNCTKSPHCRYCGESDHVNIRLCPMNCCLKCGGKPHLSCWKTGPEIHCNICDNRGHDPDLCPDLWRRYHNTVIGSLPIRTNNESSRKAYCSNCAKSGHFGYQCYITYKSKKYLEPRRDVISYKPPPRSKGNFKRKRDPSKEGAALKKMCLGIQPDHMRDDDLASCVALFNNGFLENDLDDRQSVEIQNNAKNQKKMKKLIKEKNESMRGLTEVLRQTIESNGLQGTTRTFKQQARQGERKRRKNARRRSKKKQLLQIPTVFLP